MFEANSTIWQNVVNSISDAVFILGRNGDVLYFNDAIVQLLGYTAAETLSMNTYNLVNTGQMNTHILAMLLEHKRPVTACQKYIRKDGSETLYMLVTQTPVFDQFGQVQYSVGSIRNMEYLSSAYKSAARIATHYPTSVPQKNHPNIICRSTVMEHLLNRAVQIADSDASILLCGESGTGKEVLALYIHQSSQRRKKALVTINCAALPESLLEAELFGYAKGAFTGAQGDGKPGLVETADGGTLFLDEINSMPLPLQGKLLRMLETKEVRRLGAIKTNQIDFRLLSAANVDLRDEVSAGHFRSDLYYRLSVVPLVIPPLRERREDIAPLCEHFLEHYETKYGRCKRLLPRAMGKLERYGWPGNVRELKNIIERIYLMTDVGIEEIGDIADEMLDGGLNWGELPPLLDSGHGAPPAAQGEVPFDSRLSLHENVAAYEHWMIERAMAEHGSLDRAATILGSSRSTLSRKRQEYQGVKTKHKSIDQEPTQALQKQDYFPKTRN